MFLDAFLASILKNLCKRKRFESIKEACSFPCFFRGEYACDVTNLCLFPIYKNILEHIQVLLKKHILARILDIFKGLKFDKL
jgi:hypothetical protein